MKYRINVRPAKTSGDVRIALECKTGFFEDWEEVSFEWAIFDNRFAESLEDQIKGAKAKLTELAATHKANKGNTYIEKVKV